jgi:uncharacterized protein (DUF433 family)
MNPTLGKGVYSLPEAAALTGLHTKRLREWFTPEATRKRVFASDYDPVNGSHAISFLDLVDAYVAGKLRDCGIPLQTLRKVYTQLQEDFDERHAFARHELMTDGKQVFLRAVDEAGREHVIRVLDRQHAFPKVILPFLKQLDYDRSTCLALRWNIGDDVTVDPAICLGKPIVASAGIATHVLAAAYRSNGDNAQVVADWYNVTPEQVFAAVGFEHRIAA